MAFNRCTSLNSVTFQGTISSENFDWIDDYNPTFPGDLRAKFYATNSTRGTPGTYTRPSGGLTWTKQ
jgi:hypothetical protein